MPYKMIWNGLNDDDVSLNYLFASFGKGDG